MFLNNQQIMEELKKEIKICIESNENINMTNVWDSVEAVLRGWFIAIQPYLKNQEKHQISSLILQLSQLEKRRNEETQS